MRILSAAAVLTLALTSGAFAQSGDRGTSPAPVPSVPPPTAQTGGTTVPPEKLAPPITPGTPGSAPVDRDAGNRDHDAPQSSVPPSR